MSKLSTQLPERSRPRPSSSKAARQEPRPTGLKGSLFLRSLRGSFLLLLTFLLCPAQAFVSYRTPAGQAQRWNLRPPFDPAISTNSVNPITRAIRYYVAVDGWSTWNTPAELNSVRAAFAQWQAVPGTSLRFEEAGAAPAGMDVNTADQTNFVFWAKDSLLVNGGRDHLGGALGATFYRLEGEVVAEADIALNGVTQRWFTNPVQPDDGAQFVEGIVLHEIGHWLGLAHSPVGGATMFARGDSGVNQQAGLSSDEFAALRALYPDWDQPVPVGTVQGHVLRAGLPVFGAVVLVEDARGGVLAGTVSDRTGHYVLPGLPPGAMALRVTPLDPEGTDYLVRGRDIGLDYRTVDTSFGSTAPVEVEVTAGATLSVDPEVPAVRPDFKIGYLRVPTAQATSFAGTDGPISLRPGQTGQFIGVFSTDLPTNGVVLTATGDGLTAGPTLVHPDPVPGLGLRALSMQVDVAPDAKPGSRSLAVQRTSDGAVVWANGFLVVEASMTDWNFDGLDDSFQRRWFPLFTAPEAGPEADPDGDGHRNAAELTAGTNPTNTLSVLKCEGIVSGGGGVEVSWSSIRFKRYQVWRRGTVAAGAWEPVGSPIRATDTVTRLVDSPPTSGRYYKVEVLP